MFLTGQLACINKEAAPIWTTDIGIEEPAAYLDIGELVLVIDYSRKVSSTYWLVLSSKCLGYVYEFNLKTIE